MKSTGLFSRFHIRVSANQSINEFSLFPTTYTVIHNYRTPFIYYCEINSNEQNFTKLWLVSPRFTTLKVRNISHDIFNVDTLFRTDFTDLNLY